MVQFLIDIQKTYRLAYAHKALEQFCAMHGIERAAQLKRDPEIFSAICRKLMQGLGLTLRKTAEVLETSHTNGISLNTEIPQRCIRRCKTTNCERMGGDISKKNHPFCARPSFV